MDGHLRQAVYSPDLGDKYPSKRFSAFPFSLEYRHLAAATNRTGCSSPLGFIITPSECHWGEEGATAHLERQVDGAAVRGDGHGAALGYGLVGGHGVDRLGGGQGLDLQAVLLHQGRRRRVYALEVAWGRGRER